METIPIRSGRERALQVLLFEAGGLLFITPFYHWLSGQSWGESLGLLILLSLIATSWQALYNTLFDWGEARWARRPAHLRPWRWRLIHVCGFEVTLFLITWPVIVFWTGWDWLTAALADIGLALAYTLYALIYHRLFDHWRPVGSAKER